MFPGERKIIGIPFTPLTTLPREPTSASNPALAGLLQSKQLNTQPELLIGVLLPAAKEPPQPSCSQEKHVGWPGLDLTPNCSCTGGGGAFTGAFPLFL